MSEPASGHGGVARFVPGCTALGAAAVIAAISTPARAMPVAALGLIALALAAAGVDVAGAVERGAAAVGRALFALVTGALFVVAFVPAWLWRRATGRGSLQPRRTAWSTASPASDAAFSSGTVPGARRSVTGRATWAIGCVALLLAANYGVGWAWDRATSSSGPDSLAKQIDPATTAGTQPDARVDSPALADAPWRARYLADLQRTQVGYWPYTEMRPKDFSSPYINVRGWKRATAEPKGDADLPTLWMLGGSATFGEGQRDQHTIASELVRIAQDEGVPLRISNYGQRGWVHFQEMVLYEQQLAQHDPPDFAVFYDGPNDINVQALVDEPVPSHYQAEVYAEKLTGSRLTTQVIAPDANDPDLWDVWHAYTRHSAIHKVVAWLRTSPAGASPASPTSPATAAARTQDDADRDANGQILTHPTVQDGRDAGRVYERTKKLTLELSREYGVDTLLFWQPLAAEGPAEKAAKAELSDTTIDVSQALVDHPEVFLDGVHTNEDGARIMAQVLWRSIGPKVHQWYRDHR